MTRTHWGLLLALTAINCGAAAITLQQTAQARSDFRAAAAPIGKMGAAILEAFNRIAEKVSD